MNRQRAAGNGIAVMPPAPLTTGCCHVRFILGNCIDVMRGFPDRAVDLIVTDPPYLVGFKDRSGRSIAGDKTDEWLAPATLEMYRVLKKTR